MTIAGNTVGAGSFNGLALGVGSKVHVASVEGLDDLPGVRGADSERSQDHGDYSGPDYLQGRVVTVGLHLIADTPAELRTLTDAVRAATTPQALPLPLLLFDSQVLVYAKPRRRSIPYDAENLRRVSTATVEFYCPDPRVYGAAQKSGSTGLPVDSGGFTFPLTFAWAYGSVGTPGSMILTNSGSFNARPIWTIAAGPTANLVNPSIENVQTGQRLNLNITLVPGDVLTIDVDAHTILLGGTASRRNALAVGSTWPELRPGDNQINFRASSGATSALLTGTYRDSYA